MIGIFECNLQWIEPQWKYFAALKFNGLAGIHFIASSSPDDIASFCSTLESVQIGKDLHRPTFDIVESFFKSMTTSKKARPHNRKVLGIECH